MITSLMHHARRSRLPRPVKGRRPHLESLEGRLVLSTWAFDFGTPTSPVAAGYRKVSPGYTFSPTHGYGWTGNPVSAMDRKAGNDLIRDFDYTQSGRLGFAANLTAGTYDVTVTIGDAYAARADQAIWIEGTKLDTISVGSGRIVRKTYRVDVTDGRLNLEVRKSTGDKTVLINALTITPVEAPPVDPPLFSEGFEDSNLRSRGWYDGSTYVLADGVNGSRALQYSFHEGAKGAYDSDVARHLFEGTETVYVSFDLKMSEDWEYQPSNTEPHLLYFLTNADGPYKGPASTHLTLYVEPAGSRFDVSAQDYSNLSMPHGSGVSPTGRMHWRNSEPVIRPGQWQHVEAMFKLNSLDMANDRPNLDGEARLWLDGQLLIEATGVTFRTTDFPDMKINQLLIGPYFSSGAPGEQEFWIDNLTVSTSRIG